MNNDDEKNVNYTDKSIPNIYFVDFQNNNKFKYKVSSEYNKIYDWYKEEFTKTQPKLKKTQPTTFKSELSVRLQEISDSIDDLINLLYNMRKK